MDSGLTVDQSPVDPDKWKPLLRLVPAMLIAIMIGWIESMILPDVLAGHRRNLIQACIWGATLLSLVYAIVTGLLKWWRRPVGEEAIMQAASQIARILPDTLLVSRLRPQPPPNKAIYAALPITFLGISIYGIVIDQWMLCFVFLGLALFLTGLFWFVFQGKKAARGVVLTFDPASKTVIFENFGFVTTFMPQKPRPREEIPFEEILDCTFYAGHEGGPPSLRIKTTHGPTTIGGQMENFDAIRTLLESIVTLNLADPEQHKAHLRSIPAVKVPWYGWLTLLGVIGGLGLLFWVLLTKL